MQIPQLRIDSTMAQLGLNIRKPVQQLQQPKASLSIEQPKADLNIKTRKGKLTINQRQAWDEMGMKNVFAATREYAQKGKQAQLSGIARRARQGDQLMKIEHGGNPLQAIAKANAEKPYKQPGIKFVPSPGAVKINYQPGEADVNIKAQKPRINAQVNKPIHDYTPGEVTTYLERENSLYIDFVM